VASHRDGFARLCGGSSILEYDGNENEEASQALLPYAIFCIASPQLSVICGVTQIKQIEPARKEVA
jgi:hypothetical protein